MSLTCGEFATPFSDLPQFSPHKPNFHKISKISRKTKKFKYITFVQLEVDEVVSVLDQNALFIPPYKVIPEETQRSNWGETARATCFLLFWQEPHNHKSQNRTLLLSSSDPELTFKAKLFLTFELLSPDLVGHNLQNVTS